MTPEEIKTRCDALRFVIKEATNTICTLQDECDHPSCTEGLYASEAMGIAHARPANICDFCGKPL